MLNTLRSTRVYQYTNSVSISIPTYTNEHHIKLVVRSLQNLCDVIIHGLSLNLPRETFEFMGTHEITSSRIEAD